MTEPRHSFVYSRNLKKNNEPVDHVLTIKEVASLLNCSSRHAYELVELQEIKSFSIGQGGRGLRVLQSEVTVYIERQHKKAAGE